MSSSSPRIARIYKEVWDELTTIDDKPDTIMVLGNRRLVIPEECWGRILKALHLPHAGGSKTREMAKERYYWVGMSRDMDKLVGSYVTCTKMHTSKPNDPMSESRWTAKELESMMAISADHFSIGNKRYLIVVNRYSAFPFVLKVTRMTTQETIKNGLKWELSSSYYAWSNGSFESRVGN